MNGVNVLIVEEEYLIAADIEQAIREAGAADVAIYRNVEDIPERPAATGRFQLAVVEARLGHPSVVAYVDELQRAGTAVVVTSADIAIAGAFPGATHLDKPFDSASVLRACRAALDAVPPQPIVT